MKKTVFIITIAILCMWIPLTIGKDVSNSNEQAEIERNKQHNAENKEVAQKIGGVFVSAFSAVTELAKYKEGAGNPEKTMHAFANMIHSLVDCIKTGHRSIDMQTEELCQQMLAYLETDEGKVYMENLAQKSLEWE